MGARSYGLALFFFMAFITQVARKAAELASETIRTRPRCQGGLAVLLGRDELERLLEKTLIEGVRIGQEHARGKAEPNNVLDNG
jgi:hypothetical protein